MLVLLHPEDEVAQQVLVSQKAAAIGAPVPAARRYAVSVSEYAVRPELRSEYLVDEALLRLAFDKNVQPDQRDGLPPRTFFSQSSDKV